MDQKELEAIVDRYYETRTYKGDPGLDDFVKIASAQPWNKWEYAIAFHYWSERYFFKPLREKKNNE